MNTRSTIKRTINSITPLVIRASYLALTMATVNCGAPLNGEDFSSAENDWKQFHARMVALKGYFPITFRTEHDNVRLETDEYPKHAKRDSVGTVVPGITFEDDRRCREDTFCTEGVALEDHPNYYWCDSVQSVGKESDHCVYAHKRGDILHGPLGRILSISTTVYIRGLELPYTSQSLIPAVALGFDNEKEEQEDSAMVKAMKRLANPQDSCTYILKRMEKVTNSEGERPADTDPNTDDTTNYLDVAIVGYKDNELYADKTNDNYGLPQEGHDADKNKMVDRRELLPEKNCANAVHEPTTNYVTF